MCLLYFSSFIANLWLNDLEDIGQGQRSLCMTHPIMLVIICAQYGKNLSAGVMERTRHGGWRDRQMDGCIDGWSGTIIPPTTWLGFNDVLLLFSLPICDGILPTLVSLKISQETSLQRLQDKKILPDHTILYWSVLLWQDQHFWNVPWEIRLSLF